MSPPMCQGPAWAQFIELGASSSARPLCSRLWTLVELKAAELNQLRGPADSQIAR